MAGLVGQSLSDFRQNLPQYQAQLTQEFQWVISQLEKFNIQIDRDQVTSYLDPGFALSMASNIVSGLGGVLTNSLLILLTVVFMLFEAESVPKRSAYCLGRSQHEVTTYR